MIYTDMTRKAIKLCYEAHKGQTDKSGIPYVFHPYHLAEQMNDEITTVVALLHDVLEDTDTTREDLENIGFSSEIIEAVELLTHSKPRMSDEEYDSYISNIKTNSIATTVKLADLEHNCDITRLENVTDKDTVRTERYKRGIELLKTVSPEQYEIFTEEEQKSETMKISMPENYKKIFTIAQMAAIGALPNEFDDGNILTKDIIDIGLGHPDEIYKIEAEYCISENSCFNENIDVYIHALYRKDFSTIIEKGITLSQIYQICDNADDYGIILRKFTAK